MIWAGISTTFTTALSPTKRNGDCASWERAKPPKSLSPRAPWSNRIGRKLAVTKRLEATRSPRGIQIPALNAPWVLSTGGSGPFASSRLTALCSIGSIMLGNIPKESPSNPARPRREKILCAFDISPPTLGVHALACPPPDRLKLGHQTMTLRDAPSREITPPPLLRQSAMALRHPPLPPAVWFPLAPGKDRKSVV